MRTHVRRLLLSLSIACFAALSAGMGGSPGALSDAATVTRVNIRDKQTIARNLPLVVSFSAPMVKDDAVDKPVAAGDMPFSLEPAVEGEGRWLTDSTFSFSPVKGYTRGKDYVMVLRDGLKSAEGKPVRLMFSFNVEAVKLSGVFPGRTDFKKHEIQVDLGFSSPVTSLALEKHLKVFDAESNEPLKFVNRTSGGNAYHKFVVSFGEKTKTLRFELTADGPDEGDSSLGLAEDARTVINLPEESRPAASGEESPAEAAVAGNASAGPSNLRITDVDSYQDGMTMSAVFYLSDNLAPQDQKELIAVTPNIPYVVSGSSIRFEEGVKPGMQLTVTLKAGLVDSYGRILKENRGKTLKVADFYPRIRFSDGGNFLTPVYGSRVGLDLVNIDRVDVRLDRQYENNLPLMSFYREWFVESLMRSVGFKSADVKSEKNEPFRRAVDLEALAKGQKGVFRLNVVGYREETLDSGQKRMRRVTSEDRLVVLSDIGVVSRTFFSGITVSALSLGSGKPLEGADIKVYSASNQLLASGKTGPDGLWVHKRDKVWEEQLRPNVIIAAKGGDITFLPLAWESRSELEGQDAPDYLDKGYEAFLYTPRGVFRPGETVDVKAFVRDARHMPPASFPVLFKVRSSRNAEIASGSAKLSAEGGADFAFKLPTSASTGEYSAVIVIPGQEDEIIGRVIFSVEDFVPPRLEVEVKPAKDVLVGSEALRTELSGQYLFGAPGAGLSYEFGYRAVNQKFTPKGFEEYSFGDSEKKFDTQVNLRYLTETLNEGGLASPEFTAPGDWDPAALLKVTLIGSVQEDGGRWVTQTSAFTWFPKKFLLGMKRPDGLAPNKKVQIPVAAVGPDEKTVNAGTLTAETFRVEGRWNTVYRSGRYVYTWHERLVPVSKSTVTLTDGKGFVEFTPKTYGSHLVRVATQDDAVAGSLRVYVSGESGSFGEEGSGRLDAVELALDKAEYSPGEIAKLTVKAPFAGTLLWGVERGEQLTVKQIPMQAPSVVLDIPVTEGMDPNVTVTAWVMRPITGKDKEWLAHRAFGSIPLKLSKAPFRLNAEASLPERAEPSKGLTVPFTVADAAGNPVEGEFSVALIDEGILSLTAFKTPNPTDFFYSLRRSAAVTYDSYNSLMRPEAKATPLLIPGGDGMGSGDYQGSLSTQQIFLTAYAPKVVTGPDGKGEVFFEVPEYSGKGRLMIVGASKKRFASASAPLRIARDVVLEAAAPRAVAPGDTFDLTVKVFTLEKALKGNARVTVSVDGPLALSGATDSLVPLGEGAGSKTLTIRAKAEKAHAVATIAVDVKVEGRDDLAFTKFLDVVVRPPFPRSSAAVSALVPSGSSETLALPGTWVPGSVKTSLSVDKSPVFAVLPALDYLREYPYGCLEQTVSRAWPYLTLASVEEALYPDSEGEHRNNTKAILEDVVARLASLQVRDGGFGMWPGYGHSARWPSINAAYFLVEAKKQIQVPKPLMESSIAYLKAVLVQPAGDDAVRNSSLYTAKAYAAFALARAGQAPLGWMQQLTEVEKQMQPSGRIFLAAAKALHSGKSDALRALNKDKSESAPLPYNDSMESSLRNNSLKLYAWSLVEPSAPETLGLVKSVTEELLKHRWFTTQEAGAASMALGAYLEKTGLSDKTFTAEIKAAGEVIGRVAKGETLLLGADSLPVSDKGKPEDVKITVEGGGQAYAVYSVRGVPAEAPKPASNKLKVTRIWRDEKGKVLDLSSGAVRVKKGDRITVELVVEPQQAVGNLAVSDLLPGGLEVENPRLKTAAAAAEDGGEGRDQNPEYADEGYYDEYGDYVSYDVSPFFGVYMDLREDRLLLFYDRASVKKTYTYSMRAVSKGTFMVPPVAAEGMYNPEVNAVGEASVVVVE